MIRNKAFKHALMIAMVACAILVVGHQAVGQYVYYSYDSIATVYRFDANGTPAPAPGQSGARFIYRTGTQYNDAAGMDCKGDYLYLARGATGDIARFNAYTGARDTTWSVAIPGVHALRFSPSGDLYASTYGVTPNAVYKINVETKTFVMVISGVPANYDIAFDWQGRAYLACFYQGALRYLMEGDTWTLDNTFHTILPHQDEEYGDGAYGGVYGVAVGSDDYIYVTDYYGTYIYRFDMNGKVDPNWWFNYNYRGYSLAFGPDGALYSTNSEWIYRVDLATAMAAPFNAQKYGKCEYLCWNMPRPGWITGTIDLDGYTGDLSMSPVQIKLMQGQTVVRTESVVLKTNPGKYHVLNVPDGTYDVAIAAGKALRKVQTGVVVVAGSPSTVDATLTNGDFDGDNQVTSTDLSVTLKNAP